MSWRGAGEDDYVLLVFCLLLGALFVADEGFEGEEAEKKEEQDADEDPFGVEAGAPEGGEKAGSERFGEHSRAGEGSVDFGITRGAKEFGRGGALDDGHDAVAHAEEYGKGTEPE